MLVFAQGRSPTFLTLTLEALVFAGGTSPTFLTLALLALVFAEGQPPRIPYTDRGELAPRLLSHFRPSFRLRPCPWD